MTSRHTQLPIFHIKATIRSCYRAADAPTIVRSSTRRRARLNRFLRLGTTTLTNRATRPLMYARVKAHPGVRSVYAKRLIKEGVVTEEEVKNLIDERVRRYEGALANAKRKVAEDPPQAHPAVEEIDGSEVVQTGVAAETIKTIAHKIASCRQVSRQSEDGGPLRDAPRWRGVRHLIGLAEAVAFGRLYEGSRVGLIVRIRTRHV